MTLTMILFFIQFPDYGREINFCLITDKGGWRFLEIVHEIFRVIIVRDSYHLLFILS